MVSKPTKKTCKYCDGTGVQSVGGARKACPECRGAGFIWVKAGANLPPGTIVWSV